MKKIFALMVLLLIIPNVIAINLNVEKTSSDEVLIPELNKPVEVSLKVTNNGNTDDFIFYTFFGSGMNPTESIRINAGETKNIEAEIYPRLDLQRGFVTFSYFIQGDKGDHEERLTIKVIDLEDAFEIGAEEFNLEENSIKVYIKNKVNFNFEKIEADFSSPFFEFTESFNLEPNKIKEFDIQVDKEDFKKLMAGFYTLEADIFIEDKNAEVNGVIEFVEKNQLTTKQEKKGFIITTQTIKKINEGNVEVGSEIKIKKNIISRLFTTLIPQPDIVERKGLNVYYTWNKEVKPGETLEIKARTNWFFPLLIVFFIVSIIILAKQYSKTNVILKKRINFVRAKGGEFALKVTIKVQAKKYVERVSVTDRLPPLVKIHERFGTEKPKKVDEQKKKIEWFFEKLETGETRVLSYIIYSKVGVVGKFALPSATAIYERDGQIQESNSNKAFFVAEQRQKGKEE